MDFGSVKTQLVNNTLFTHHLSAIWTMKMLPSQPCTALLWKLAQSCCVGEIWPLYGQNSVMTEKNLVVVFILCLYCSLTK